MSSTPEQQLATAAALKGEGNKLVEEKEYQKAASKYSKIFLYTRALTVTGEAAGMMSMLNRSTPKLTDAQDKEAKDLEVAAWLNLSFCHYNLKNYDKAVEYSTKGIKLREDNAKGWYRRAQALFALGKLGDAADDVERANKLAPADPLITRLKTTVDSKLRSEDSAFRKQFATKFQQQL